MNVQPAGHPNAAPAALAPLAIEGVEGGTAAFLGFARQGPSVSVCARSLPQYEAFFGARRDDAPDYLWYAVKGFFDNGGRAVHVTRVRTLDADAACADEHALAQALDALAANRDAALLCAPGVRLAQGHERLCRMLLAHCEALGWRFALLDTPAGATPDAARALRDSLRSEHGALYYPWIEVPGADGRTLVPPSGHLAGLYADSDDQPGTHKAPANLPVAGALALERPIGDDDYGALAPHSVNCLRSPPNRRGVWVWGARTLGEDRQSNFVAVRRYLLYLQRSIERGLDWVRFRPNGEPLWDEIACAVSDFLHREWRRGALMGASAQEAYFVRCDRGSLPQAGLDTAGAVVQLGVALVEPSHYVQLRLVLQAQA
jgi:phage tail sheath protein FI